MGLLVVAEKRPDGYADENEPHPTQRRLQQNRHDCPGILGWWQYPQLPAYHIPQCKNRLMKFSPRLDPVAFVHAADYTMPELR